MSLAHDKGGVEGAEEEEKEEKENYKLKKLGEEKDRDLYLVIV